MTSLTVPRIVSVLLRPKLNSCLIYKPNLYRVCLVRNFDLTSVNVAGASRRCFATSSTNMADYTNKTLFEDLGVGSDMVALTTGAPGDRHLRRVGEMLDKASRHLVETTKDTAYLQYGIRQGSLRFRDQLSKFLSDGYQDKVNSDSLVVTSGATHGLHLAASILTAPDAPVFVEDPTYFIAINILKNDLGRKVVGVPADNDGIDLAALEAMLKEKVAEGSSDGMFRAIVYLIPTYHNPRGYCVPADRCRALVELARKYRVMLFTDDVYNLLHFDPDTVAPPRLFSYDKPNDPDYQANVISNGTFSKILSPGLRLGWIEGGAPVVKKLVSSNILLSAGSSNHYASELVASALELNLEQQYLRDLNAEYKDTVAAVVKLMESKLPASVTFNRPKGGYFIWIEMPKGAKSVDVVTECMKVHNIKALMGNMCSASGSYENCIRISFSHYPLDVLTESITKLCDVITKHVNSL